MSDQDIIDPFTYWAAGIPQQTRTCDRCGKDFQEWGWVKRTTCEPCVVLRARQLVPERLLR